MEVKVGKSHHARKALFRKGIRQGFLTVEEIEEALPAGTLTPAERWLLYYSLRAAEIEVLGDEADAIAAGLEEEMERDRAGRETFENPTTSSDERG